MRVHRLRAKSGIILLSLCFLTGGGWALGQQSTASSRSGTNSGQASTPTARVPREIVAGLLLNRVAPAYPKKARKQHIQGTVILEATITKNGDIADLRVVSGDPILAEAAVDAVRQWKYRPYIDDGKAVDVESTIQVNFTLK